MAKYVLVSFANDADADAFVTSCQQGRTLFARQVAEVQDSTEYKVLNFTDLSSYVRGVYKQPTQFHDPSVCKAGKNVGFTRGTKYGWLVCAQCGKPTGGWAKGDSWYSAL